MTAPIAGDPVNTYTVTIADAHSHSVSSSGIAARTKDQAALSVLQIAGQQLSALLATDTWTITITQP